MMDFVSIIREQLYCSAHRRRRNRIARSSVTLCFVIILLWFLVPVIFHVSPAIQRYFIFLNTVNDGVDLTRPEDLGLPGTRNFRLTTAPGVTVGLWHILPESLIHSAPVGGEEERAAWFEGSLSDSRPIILYAHGNKGCRGQSHRVELYALLRTQDYHIITFDYRGYGDSTHVMPSETGLVADTKAVYTYLRDKAKQSSIIIWGHSLGTGVSCHAVSDLCDDVMCPNALVLEAAFNNIKDEVRHNPLSQVFYYLPYFDWAFVNTMKDIDAEFKSDIYIQNINCPILMLHTQDDHVVPIELARKLEKAGLEGRDNTMGAIQFIEFDGALGLGHNNIHQAPKFDSIIREFVKKAAWNPAQVPIHRIKVHASII